MLQNDPQFISNPKRQRELNGLLSGNRGDAWKMPEALTREELDRALRQGREKSIVKPWADIEIFGERVDMSYDSYNNAQWR